MKPTQEQVIAWAREAGIKRCDCDQRCHLQIGGIGCITALVSLAYEAGRTAEREKVAAWMIQRSYATGHGDTTEDLLAELDWQIAENWNRAMINGIEAGRKDENEAFEKELSKEDPEWLDDEAFHIVTKLLEWARARREQ